MKSNNYRHGDVDLLGIEKLPEGLKEIKHDGSFILAYGEATGHHHKITAERLRIYQDAEGKHYLQVGESAELTHQEHKTITILPGIYRQEQEREYDYWSQSTRRVLD
jgi:hypothetical protein